MTDQEDKKQEKPADKPSSQELTNEELGEVAGGLSSPTCGTCGNLLYLCTCNA